MAFTQPATFNEPWSDARIESYLNVSAPKGINEDFHILQTAFKHMRVEDFTRLLQRFVALGKDINAKGPHELTLLGEIRQYPRQANAFIEALKAVGAEA